uniref:Serine/threonine-protein kinase ATR n=2 Tax=Parascaris univalens TaxID=6257 RepID=A0A915C076_PARUN
MEAAWHLHQWSRLSELIDKHPAPTSWGATNASILCSLKYKDDSSMNARIENARARLVDSLTAMTIEDSDTYAQAYKYITQLHILAEIEEAKETLCSLKGDLTPERLTSVLNEWQRRSAYVMQCTAVLEPIFIIRRGLLHLTESNLAQAPICELLLHSCRLSRLAGHLQIAWAYLVEAKALNVNHFEVAMEEARFLFEKGNQTQAIGILSTLLEERFSAKVQQLQFVIEEKKKQLPSSSAQLKESLRNEPKEEKDNFVKVQLLLADYSLRAGACSFADLYSKYNALPAIADPSEDLYYRVAIFLDNYLYSKNENLVADKVTLILQAYVRVLTQGRSHLFHVMPRMLTIWLDNAQKKVEEVTTAQQKKPNARDVLTLNRNLSNEEKEIREMNAIMRDAFSRLDHYMFYTAFAQLISRITHPNEEVFNTLKNILAELLMEYPHQCLWQSIAVYRSDQKKQQLRFTRCRTVYDIAKRKDRSGQLQILISQYEYAAAAFIKVAEDAYPPGSHSLFSQKYPFIADYFKIGVMDPTVKISSTYESDPSRPLVVVPLREMIEHALPVAIPNSLSQYPVGESSSTKSSTSIGNSSFSNIYIHSIDEQFIVMKSMVRPKKITLVASDGKRYALMCKAKDELRKDCRLMDINRMVNALLHQNADSRRRQLSVRTYNVVPLQDAGGLIEWVPNLRTYRSVLEPLMAERCLNVMSDKEWFANWIPHGTDEQKYERLVNEYFPRHPVVMADWFRRNFPDPCKWYAARLAFTHTSAVMSMVGFVLGLGDRHGENLLIDVTNGDAIHVDFNLLFNKGENLAVPEVVPFRLTRNIVNGFGVTGVEGAFRRSCETTMRVLRENEAVLHTVLQTFVHDPLLEWMHSEVRAQQLKQRQGISGSGAKPCNSMAQQQAQEAIEMIRSRLRGNIVSPRIYRNTLDSLPMSVEGQVGKLIQLASDEHNLAKMYIGWCPFL